MCFVFAFFFFNDTATTEIYTLSLHDALPIYGAVLPERAVQRREGHVAAEQPAPGPQRQRLPAGAGPRPVALEHDGHGLVDRKSTRLNSSHANISYAVFCLKKKKQTTIIPELS